MMKSKLIQAISILLIMSLLLTMFSGCQKQFEGGIIGEASSVAYNAEGKFTTIIKADNISFSENLAVSDVTVSYFQIDEKAFEKDAKEKNADKIDHGNYMKEVKSTVTGVTRKDDKTLEVSFTDEKAGKNLPSSYFVRIDKTKTGTNKEMGAQSQVTYPQHTITSNIEFISVFDKDIRLMLELKEGEFKQDISKDAITLEGCLEKMNIESMSASGKNLTIQLTGDITKNESSNAYVDGLVVIGKEALKDGYQEIKVQLPVNTVSYGFDADKLTVENGKVIVPFVISGYRLTDKVNADSFKIDGAKVVEFKKTDESSGIITITGLNATDKNSAAAALDNKTVTVAGAAMDRVDDLSFEADFRKASFYPVFDYAEEKSEQYIITLYLYAHAGIFADTLSNDMLGFDDNFKDAKVIEFTRESNNTAKLVISVPSGGKPVEGMQLNGTVTLDSKSLISRWGDYLSGNSTYTRVYDQKNMGKDLSDVDISAIKKIVGGFGNTTMGTIFSVGSGLGSAGSAAINALEMLGVIESEKAKLDKIYNAIEGINDELQNIQFAMSENSGKDIANRVADFYHDKLLQLDNYRMLAAALIEDAKAVLKEEGVVEPTNKEDYVGWDTYMQKVMSKAVELDRTSIFANLLNYYSQVQAKITSANVLSNILDEYDQYMTYYYNFDVETYNDRETFHTLLEFEMAQSSALLCAYYRYGSNKPSQSSIDLISNRYESTKKVINNSPVNRRTDKKAYMYLNGKTYSKAFWASAVNTGVLKLSDEQADSFIRRLNGKTALEVIRSLGIAYEAHGDTYPSFCWRGETFEKAAEEFAGNGLCYWYDYSRTGDAFFTKEIVTYTTKVIPENVENPTKKTGEIGFKMSSIVWSGNSTLIDKPQLGLKE